ncbi:hypothetical protein Tco_1236244 [Tanacetum coccineum]
MRRDTIQLEDAVSTISKEYLLEFTSEYGIPKSLHPELPGLGEPIVEFPEGKVGVYTKLFEFANYHMDLFNLISALNPAKVKTGTRPRAAHEVPLLNVTASHDGLSHEILPVETATTTEVIQELWLEKEVAAMGPPVNKRRLKRGNDEAEANAPPKVLRKDHATFRLAQSTLRGKSLALIELEAGSTFFIPTTQETPADAKSVSDPEPLCTHTNKSNVSHNANADLPGRRPPEIPTKNVATAEVHNLLSTESPGSGKSTSVPSVDGSPGNHIVSPRYFSELRHLLNTDFLSLYNINLARQVAMGSQLRLRFEQEVRLLKKATSKIARRDQRIQAKEGEIKRLDQEIKSLRTVEAKVHGLHNRTKNLETLLEAEVDMKKATEAKNVGQAKELESLRFKKYEDDRVEQRCAKMDARLDKLSVDFDEELYPHMLTAIAGLVKGMSEGLEHGIEHGKADRDLAAVEAYDPEANSKYVKALQDLKDLKYPLVDQLEKLKDAPMELIMESLHLESDSGEDAR